MVRHTVDFYLDHKVATFNSMLCSVKDETVNVTVDGMMTKFEMQNRTTIQNIVILPSNGLETLSDSVVCNEWSGWCRKLVLTLGLQFTQV